MSYPGQLFPQWSMCVSFKNWHCELCHITVEHLSQNDASALQLEKNPDWAPQMARKEEERCLQRRGKGMRRSKWRKREFPMNQVDFQQGLFSFWCIFLHTWLLWSCVFSTLVRHPKHHIPVFVHSLTEGSMHTSNTHASKSCAKYSLHLLQLTSRRTNVIKFYAVKSSLYGVGQFQCRKLPKKLACRGENVTKMRGVTKPTWWHMIFSC